MAKEILKIENVVKRFGNFTAVAGVSLSFYEGERVGLIGPNGAGKTTLINLISGHLKPDQGKIFFKGRDITKMPPPQEGCNGFKQNVPNPLCF